MLYSNVSIRTINKIYAPSDAKNFVNLIIFHVLSQAKNKQLNNCPLSLLIYFLLLCQFFTFSFCTDLDLVYNESLSILVQYSYKFCCQWSHLGSWINRESREQKRNNMQKTFAWLRFSWEFIIQLAKIILFWICHPQFPLIY